MQSEGTQARSCRLRVFETAYLEDIACATEKNRFSAQESAEPFVLPEAAAQGPGDEAVDRTAEACLIRLNPKPQTLDPKP